MEELPYEVNYILDIQTTQEKDQIIQGWEAINYTIDAQNMINTRIKGDVSHMPGFEVVLQEMAININSKTPLQELQELNRTQELISRCNIINGKHSDIPKFEKSE